jgi:hypothetical protein|nr:MAG TPA: hypothetical protein [Caudoviricetes sp.]
MFIHDHYKKLAIEAIKKDLKNFNEDCLEEIAYNEKDFNNRIFILNYSNNNDDYLYEVNVHQESVDVKIYSNEYFYSVEDKKQ